MNPAATIPTVATGRVNSPRASATLGVLLLLPLLYGFNGLAAYRHAADGPAPVSVSQAFLRIDPNVATRDELLLLPGIGPKIADNILEYRAGFAPQPAFQTAEDLDHVSRIGPASVEKLRDWLRFPADTKKEIPREKARDE